MRGQALNSINQMHSTGTTTLERCWSRIYFVLLLLLCAAVSWRPLKQDDDVWGHAAVGRWMLQHHAIPHQTLFLCSFITPIRWVDHEWLSRLVFYGLMSLAGPPVILAFNVAMVGLLYAVLWKFWSSKQTAGPWRALLFSMAIWAGAPRYYPRPGLFSALFLVCLLVFLIQWQDESEEEDGKTLFIKHWPKLLAIYVMFVVWTNLHGAVAYGLALLGLSAVIGLVEDRCARRSRLLALFSLVCLSSLLINPYGIGYVQAWRAIGGQTFANLEEWRPLFAAPKQAQVIIILPLFFIVAVVSWLRSPDRRYLYLIWIVAVTGAVLHARRFTWEYIIVCLAVSAACAKPLPVLTLSRKTPILRGIFAGATILILSFLIYETRLLVIAPGESQFATVSPYIPEQIADIIKRDSHGNIFNNYECSSYMEWRLGEGYPLFIDFINAYDYEVYRQYILIASVDERAVKTIDELPVDCVVFTRHNANHPMRRLAAYLDTDPFWNKVYDGDEGMLWLRRSELPTRIRR